MLFLLIFSSCITTQQDAKYLNDQIVALNNRVSKLEGSVDKDQYSDLNARLKVISESQAEMGSDIDNVRAEMLKLSSRVDDRSQLVRRTVERDTAAQDAMRAGLNDLDKRTATLEKEVKRIQEYLKQQAPGVPAKKAPPKVTTQVKGPEPKATVPKEKPVSPEKQLYDMTHAKYRDGKYEEAITGFRGFLRKYPKSDLADNAQFWIGESYMGLKQYEKAILAYQEVIKNYPKGNKVPNAILRQAIAFYEIKDKTSSRLLLKKVIKKHPNSSEAGVARAKLKTLK